MLDLTVAAVPFYFASMGAESWWLRRRGDRPVPGAPAGAVGYERSDTITSLAMGTASLVVPAITKPLLRRLDPGRHRAGRIVLGAAGGAALLAAAADAVARARDTPAGELPGVPDDTAPDDTAPDDTAPDDTAPDQSATEPRGRLVRTARRVAGSSALGAIVGAGAVVAGTWANRTLATRLHRRRVLPDWGTGAAATAAAVLGWDAIYYWNHRIQHEARYLWAIHVVHHSSEHYNLSTALRQPVADALGTFAPYGLLSLLGCSPELVERARGINLIYQFWIHTEVIGSLGPLERILNTPSHHRVHHGANSQYLDRNHGSILITWDRLFGTFEPERERVTYGLTKNIRTHDPLRVATHEYADIGHDVVRSDSWGDRLGFVVRGPGWAAQRRRELGWEGRSRPEPGFAA